MIKYALLSVFDKTGINDIALFLIQRGYTIAATEGTGKELTRGNIPFVNATELTGTPDILRDCLQTFSFNLAGGILFDRNNTKHINEVSRENLPRIDVVICNVTDIAQTVTSPSDFNIQNVDLGGPSMLRAAAINYRQILVVPSVSSYDEVKTALERDSVDMALRLKMAIRTFKETARYDIQLSTYLSETLRL